MEERGERRRPWKRAAFCGTARQLTPPHSSRDAPRSHRRQLHQSCGCVHPLHLVAAAAVMLFLRQDRNFISTSQLPSLQTCCAVPGRNWDPIFTVESHPPSVTSTRDGQGDITRKTSLIQLLVLLFFTAHPYRLFADSHPLSLSRESRPKTNPDPRLLSLACHGRNATDYTAHQTRTRRKIIPEHTLLAL